MLFNHGEKGWWGETDLVDKLTCASIANCHDLMTQVVFMLLFKAKAVLSKFLKLAAEKKNEISR
jgi:hypothetical protein